MIDPMAPADGEPPPTSYPFISIDKQSSVLVVEKLCKSYGNREALRDLSFTLQPGHILGFLGPNGAGKTTAIRILTTILEATSGQFTIDGISSQQPGEIRRRIGVLPESLGFAKDMTALELLTYFGTLYGYSPAHARKNGLALLEEVGLQHRAKSLIGSYSRGMRQRLGIARALVHDPAVLFLDEPTLGLDPQGQQELLRLIRRIAADHQTGIIFCSHDLPEVETLCHEVIILRSGHIIAQGTVAEVIERSQRNVVRIQAPIPFIPQARQALEARPDVMMITTGSTPDWLDVQLMAFTPDETSQPITGEQMLGQSRLGKNQLLNTLIRADVPILSYYAEGGRLQDVFLQLTEEGA